MLLNWWNNLDDGRLLEEQKACGLGITISMVARPRVTKHEYRYDIKNSGEQNFPGIWANFSGGTYFFVNDVICTGISTTRQSNLPMMVHRLLPLETTMAAALCLTVHGESLLLAGLGISLLSICFAQASIYQGLPLEQLGMSRFVEAPEPHSCSTDHLIPMYYSFSFLQAFVRRGMDSGAISIAILSMARE